VTPAIAVQLQFHYMAALGLVVVTATVPSKAAAARSNAAVNVVADTAFLCSSLFAGDDGTAQLNATLRAAGYSQSEAFPSEESEANQAHATMFRGIAAGTALLGGSLQPVDGLTAGCRYWPARPRCRYMAP